MTDMNRDFDRSMFVLISLHEPGLFHFCIVNGDLSEAYTQLKTIALNARSGRMPQPQEVKTLPPQVSVLTLLFWKLSRVNITQLKYIGPPSEASQSRLQNIKIYPGLCLCITGTLGISYLCESKAQ